MAVGLAPLGCGVMRRTGLALGAACGCLPSAISALLRLSYFARLQIVEMKKAAWDGRPFERVGSVK